MRTRGAPPQQRGHTDKVLSKDFHLAVRDLAVRDGMRLALSWNIARPERAASIVPPMRP